MRRVALVLCIAASTAVAAPRASNPAFLGITMRDVGPRGPCMVDSATRDSPAQAAGLTSGDAVLAIDEKPIASCAMLLDEITGHLPGDVVLVRIQRAGVMRAVKVQLTTRDAMLRKMLGRPMVETNLMSIDDGAVYDLSSLRGRMAIVGLYHPQCVDCAPLFGRFAAWARTHARDPGGPPLVLAVAAAGESAHDLRALQRSLDVPLATGEFGGAADFESSAFGRELVLADRDRLGVIVIDGRGTVQYIGPIAPNSDDTEAVLDELFAAADQASRAK